MATDPIPALDLVPSGKPILIDSIAYEVKHPEALSLRQSLIVERAFVRISALVQQLPNVTADEECELSVLLQQVCAEVLTAPPEVQRQLTEHQRFQVFLLFNPLRSRLSPPATGGPATADSPSTSGSGSPDSSASTARRRAAAGTRTSRKP